MLHSQPLMIASLLITFVLIILLIAVTNTSAIDVLHSLWLGAFGTPDRFARVLATLAPLVLCASGLTYTFAAGLYNLGVEGQMTIGAIATTFILRLGQDHFPTVVLIFLGLIFGLIGGVIWGGLVGWLKNYGQISEIFAGLGLNFVAQGITLYLIFGPWQREGIASMSGTEPFDATLWLPTIGQTEASPIALLLAAIGLILTFIILHTSDLGLKLRAIGHNPQAAYVLGVPSRRYLFYAFGLCGAFAGLAGSLQVLAVFHRLIPNISSNLGFLGLLVILLSELKSLWILPIALFFSALNVGSLQLPLGLQMESSLAGVIQGMLVLMVLLSNGIRGRNNMA